MIVFDNINTLLIVILLFNVALLMPLLRSVRTNVQTLMYAINIITILLWLITMIGYRSQGIYFDIWLRALYCVAIFIGVTYMQFTFYYPIKMRYAKYGIYFINFFAVVMAGIVAMTDTIIVRGVHVGNKEPEIIFGDWYILYILIILVPFILGFLRHSYLIIQHKSKVRYLFFGYFISANTAFITNLLLPWFGIFIVNWVGQFFTIIMVSFTTYSIIRFNLMNMKFFAVNVGVALLLIITFSQILFADTLKDVIVSSVVFVISLATGIYLVRLREQENKSFQKTKTLNTKIKKINEELQVANQQLQSLDTLKSEFISLASHQLRSPLTVIKGYASTLTDGIVGDLTPKQYDIVRHIYISAQGLASLVEDFLNVTKIEQGGMTYAMEEHDIEALVEDLAEDMKKVAEDKNLSFSYHIEQEMGDYKVVVDALKIKQVFLNLIDNAIKYTKVGAVQVHLTKNQETKKIVFSVTDSGVGLSPETQEKLFTKFARGEGGRLNSGGSGLGLYLAHVVVLAHHGAIIGTSDGEGKGSTFTVTIPY